MAQGTCSFGGILLTANGRYVNTSNSFIVAERDVEFVEIPGKDGAIAFDNGRFKNVIIPVEIYIRSGFQNSYRNLMNILYTSKGYQKLKLPYRNDAYRLAVFHSAVTFETGPWLESGRATLNFNCKPFWYLNSGDEWVTCRVGETVSLSNTRPLPAKPLIRLYGNGSVTLGNQLIVSATGIDTSQYPYVDIDCEAMTVSYEDHNLADYVSVYEYGGGRGFPTIPAHTYYSVTVESNDGNDTYVRIKPRWVEL